MNGERQNAKKHHRMELPRAYGTHWDSRSWIFAGMRIIQEGDTGDALYVVTDCDPASICFRFVALVVD